MRFYWRGGLATLFAPAFLMPFIGFAINGSLPMTGDTRGVAGAGFAAGLMMRSIAVLHDPGHLGAPAVRR